MICRVYLGKKIWINVFFPLFADLSGKEEEKPKSSLPREGTRKRKLTSRFQDFKESGKYYCHNNYILT